ncbi:DNA replication protein DnaD [Anoxybacillus sp. P3H1B]|uniref:DnaD domain-containing protein n=1 Tax=Anoxybacteroides rupiense TaxID=311460 RepID=A0ABD5IW06_9BACL|nr:MULTISPECIES: DnaD domain-containing protein [Anoxybacillus]KXG11004.1 DNA replication protein DnaD [Anoxybacillus sp. P3H1B]MED5051955.1 DnaD domain-containing protein [Anoxybacillus rupiensis]QHC04520.1 DnaD domain protein [Anoxybacillus sp. PDR2]
MDKEKMAEWLAQGSIAIPKLLLQHYKRLGLTEVEFMLLLHLHAFMGEGVWFPTPDELAERMTLTPAQCMEALRKLLQKGFVSIEEQVDGAILGEKYSLKPLWEKLVHHLISESMNEQKKERQEEEQSLYTMFEQEFGRPLSPFECETLAMWMDQDGHDPAIIKAALREAVLSGKLNFRYIDRILFEWKKNGVRTIEQAKDYGQKFRKHQSKAKPVSQEEHRQTVTFYNWLES